MIFNKQASNLLDRLWLGGSGQWVFRPGPCQMAPHRLSAEQAAAFAGKSVLELGTPRGRMTAMMETLGCQVTTRIILIVAREIYKVFRLMAALSPSPLMKRLTRGAPC